ncbi:MAG TPA: cytochrome P450 [Solirubrobacteraceae bacterium]|nr:cytochrome P450 [Solirubrobacteraceae bacterium]
MPSSLQAIGWALRPLPFLERCGRRYGDAFTLRIRRGSPWVLVTDPADVRRVFTADASMVQASAVEANPLLGPLLGPRSVMLLDEPEHMAHRKLMLPSFHGERMKSYERLIVEVTRREVDGWPIGEPFALWPRMQAISTEVIMSAVFGGAETDDLRRLRELLKGLTGWLSNSSRLALIAGLGPRWLSRSSGFRAAIEPVEAAVLDEVRRRRAAPGPHEGEDILSMLEQAHDESGSPMSEREVRDELITLLSDGPTATSLAWAFERLLRHPDKLARLREEALTGESDAYADAVVKETLRLCPIVPLIMRRLLAPMRLAGCTIPAGTTVAPCVHLIHRREDLYPQPRAFMPERFLDHPPGTYTWIPFGGGVRRCLAASFAQLAIKRVVQTVLSEVDLRAAASRSEGARRGSVAFAPGERALAIVTRRLPGGDPAPRFASAPRTAAPLPAG